MLQMVGIDHEKADLSTREIFSYNRHSVLNAMELIQEHFGVQGVILLSTCNRTELYISTDEKLDSVFPMLCATKQVDVKQYQEYAVERSKDEAVDHLFQLACGIKSKIFGEDQIVSQVKNALFLAREAGTADSFLEMVFQAAIASAKKVKTEVHLTAVKTSVVEEMLATLKAESGTIEQKECLVIGNGEIGRLAAQRLVESKASVTMTVRSYKSKEVEIPKGCRTIDYKERYDRIASYDIVVSATTSPHHTVKYEECHTSFENEKQYIFIDLAVPRDISTKFGEMSNIRLYNIDSLGGTATSVSDNEALALALEIIKEEEEEFLSQTNFRVYVPVVQNIGDVESKRNFRRMEKKIRKVAGEEQLKELESVIEQATAKTITSMLFDLRKNLPMKYWKACLEAFEKNMQE